MDAKDLPLLKKGELLFNRANHLVFEVYGWPHEYKGEWRVQAYVFDKPRKNVNHIYILKHNCHNFMKTSSARMCKVLLTDR